MDGGGRDFEELLEVSLGRRSSVEQGVCVDEGQILALLFGELRVSGHGIGGLI